MGLARSILVIDDADDVRHMVMRQLVHLGYEARGASNGVEGLLAVEASAPALVLCDLRMPQLDGLGVLEAMCREVGITKTEFAALVDAVQAAIGRWGNFAKQAGVPKEISAEARSWHRRIRERVCGH
jgi:CheY-like chemotaxis protein